MENLLDPLYQGIKDGDPQVMRQIYEEQFDKVVHWIIKNGGSEADGQDIFQDTLEAIIIGLHKNKIPERSSPGAYIMQIAKNKWIDKIRRKKVDQRVRSDEFIRPIGDKTVEETYIAVEEEQSKYRLMDHTLKELSELCQKLVRMILAEKKTEEIVSELNFPNANAMYRRKFGCMKTWKDLIQKYRG